ncbi:uncharacterized protein LOC135384687 [Ornithodoros turicata]|uniref:uncharacterized protein LOC135384687 n=1 Tax=Ornithodoros turicata TaxID=34597 RepID=UPI00313A0162
MTVEEKHPLSPQSGTEEQYDEKEKLLQEVVDNATEFGNFRRRAPRPKAVASAARDAALAEVDTRKRRREDQDLDFVERRAEREFTIKERQLNLEERRVQLEERRLRLDEDREAFDR